MFRFSFDEDAPLTTDANQLAEAGITEDVDWATRLAERGEAQPGERTFRAENESPDTPEEAVSYVQGVMLHAPDRVWIDGTVYDVDDEIRGRARKPQT